MKKLLISFLLLISLTANASNIQTIKIEDGFLSRVFLKISYCKINPVCYFREKLGSTITTITGTETVSYALKTTVNDNFTALNNGKIEISTTTLPLITTLSGLTSANSLTSVGTITSGVWSGTTIATAKGGTGSTTLASNQVLLGNGTGNIGIVAGQGTTGQFLTSNGAGSAPTWQTSAVDTAINYTWTGTHSFSNLVSLTRASTTRFSVFDLLYVGGSATSTIQGSTTGTSTMQGNLVINNNASTTNLTISNTCVGCLNGYEQITTTDTNNFGGSEQRTITATCTGNKKVIGGGFGITGSDGDLIVVKISKFSGTNAWVTDFKCASASQCDEDASSYAICVNP